MSFDPFHEQQPLRDPVPRPPLDSAGMNTPVPDVGANPATSSVRERMLFPAVLLLVTGVLNLLFGGFSLLRYLTAPPVEAVVAEAKKESMKDPKQAEQMAQLEKMGYSLEGVFAFVIKSMLVMGVSNLVVALLTLFAGVRVLQLRSYGLVVFASILTAIPFVSGSACCCIGEVAGLYSIIMLLQSDIRDAFR